MADRTSKRLQLHVVPGDGETPPADGPPPAPQTVSEILRAAREARGLTIHDVADAVRIRAVNLQAIEDAAFDRLPGAAYAIGFVRSYAEYLGFPGEQMVQRFKAEAKHAATKPKLIFPVAIRERRAPTGGLLLLGVLLAAVIYGGWWWLRATDRHVADLVPALPERLARLVGNDRPAETQPTPPIAPLVSVAPTGPVVIADPTLPTVNPQPVMRSTPTVSAQLVMKPVEPSEGEAPDPVPVPGAAPTPAATLNAAEAAGGTATTPAPTLTKPEAPTLAPGTFGVDPAKSRVAVRASKESWLQVRDGAGQAVLTRVLKAGEIYYAPNEPGMSMTVGNAGGIDVLVDGKETRSLGAAGQVLKNVSLDPARLQARGSAPN
jgi:cytoskeleton protein RodZ